MRRYCKCKIPIMNEVTHKCMTCGETVKTSILKIRKRWKRKSQTQIKKSDKIYSRRKAKRRLRKEEE